MKKLLVTLAAVLVSVSAFAQGTINVNNRNLTDPTTGALYQALVTPTAATANATAQLFRVGAGGVLTPLGSPLTFRTGAAAGYLNPAVVTVAGAAPGTAGVTVRLRAWVGATYETASLYGESNDVTVGPLGGDPGTGAPPITPPNLNGLREFAMVPEPSTIALGVLGAAALLLRRRK